MNVCEEELEKKKKQKRKKQKVKTKTNPDQSSTHSLLSELTQAGHEISLLYKSNEYHLGHLEKFSEFVSRT